MQVLRQVIRDLGKRRHVEVHVVAAAALVLAVLSLFGDLVGDEVRWAVVLAALGLLTGQIALPSRAADLDDVLHTRASFDDVTFVSRLRGASEVWIFGPSAVTALTTDVIHHLRAQVLNRRDGVVRIAVLDPDEPAVVELAARQLDYSTDFQAVDLAPALTLVVNRIERMAGWDAAGTFEYGFVPFNPGFSLVAINPYGKDGLLIVEFHALQNESTASRMHIELTRGASEHWFVYWRAQFEHLWLLTRRPR